MEFFPPTRVRLDDGPFADALQTDLAYVRALDARPAAGAVPA